MNQVPVSVEITEYLELAEYQLKEALTKAMICKNSNFVEKLRDAHATVRELIEEV